MKDSRYNRHVILEKIGEQGQQKLLQSKIWIIGCGGLGSIIAPYLAGAGIGHLILVDGDTVDISNLHRQVFYKTEDQGKNKVDVLKDHCLKLNPSIYIETFDQKIDKTNIDSILKNVDLAVECTDEIYVKYLVNDFCFINRIPLVYGAIYKYEGYVSLFKNTSEKSIHLRDIFPTPQNDLPSCSEVGVLATIAGITAILQANEVIKFITDIGESLSGQLLTYSVLENKQMTLKLRKSFKKDISEIYTNSNYNSVQEITWFELNERDDIELICILEKEEEYKLEKEHLHIPLSQWKESKSILEKDKKYAIFCMSGKRSKSLIESQNRDLNLINIKGGFNDLPLKRS